VALSWSTAAGADNYAIWIGTTTGAFDLYSVYTTLTTATVPVMPRAAGIADVRLWARVGGNWLFNDYSYTTSVSLGITSPAPGSSISAATALIAWNGFRSGQLCAMGREHHWGV